MLFFFNYGIRALMAAMQVTLLVDMRHNHEHEVRNFNKIVTIVVSRKVRSEFAAKNMTRPNTPFHLVMQSTR